MRPALRGDASVVLLSFIGRIAPVDVLLGKGVVGFGCGGVRNRRTYCNARTTYRTGYPVEATWGEWPKTPHFSTLSMALARALALFWITNACNRVTKTITVIALHGNMSHCNKTNIIQHNGFVGSN